MKTRLIRLFTLILLLSLSLVVNAKHEATAQTESKGHEKPPLLKRAKEFLHVDSPTNDKLTSLNDFKSHQQSEQSGIAMFKDDYLTTDLGVRLPKTDDSLKAGERGPTLMEDFHLREKIMRFDHERIPERVVHARGAAAHGYFQVYKSLSHLTSAHFLNDPSLKTPVFVRFSTVQGPRGSADTVRDVRGFATKFYTQEGNFDLVGNNMPVFFIQDGIKFPDLIHAVKPEPNHDIPTGQSAHDSFWDFVSLSPESAHMIMWAMSDRGIPQKLSTMEGFGVHTFRLVDSSGKSRFVKFHWKPVLGVHSHVWDEAVKIQGADPDFHRRDLWESIEMGMYPEWEFGIQVLEEKDADHFMKKYNLDILDVTKLWPEEVIPVQKVGKLVLNRNPDNFFSETEQVAFCVSNLVPGIDVTNDPMMQARLFSYLDTQLTRLGGPNFNEIPINRPICPVHNNQQDGFMRQRINMGSNYLPNTISGNSPKLDTKHGYTHYPERLSEGVKTRNRPESFADFWTQAAMFFWSLAPWEQDHLISAISFENSKVKNPEIRQRVVNNILCNIEAKLAQPVALNLGISLPKNCTSREKDALRSPALSLANSVQALKGRRLAILVAPGFDESGTQTIIDGLNKKSILSEVYSVAGGPINGSSVTAIAPLFSVISGFVDGVYVAGGSESVSTLMSQGHAIPFIREAYRHGKPIFGTKEGADLVKKIVTDDLKSLHFSSIEDLDLDQEKNHASDSSTSSTSSTSSSSSSSGSSTSYRARFMKLVKNLHAEFNFLRKLKQGDDTSDYDEEEPEVSKDQRSTKEDRHHDQHEQEMMTGERSFFLSPQQGIGLSYENVNSKFVKQIIKGLETHRFWNRHEYVPPRA